MNIIVISVIAILILVALVMVVALFAKKEFTVQRTITINKPMKDVFEYIRFLENHKTFSKWTTQEPSKSKPGTGTDGQEGYILSWNNYKEKAGVGELEIKKIINGSRIDLEHHYIKPLKGLANAYMAVNNSSGDSTELKWVYSGISNYPINLLTSIMNMDKIVGRDLENGLSKLKYVLEESK